MTWPYHFLTLNDEQKLQRRELLDRYGAYAQFSALVPVLAYQLYRLGVWVSSERHRTDLGYTHVPETPGSPSRKKSRQSSTSAIARHWRSLLWWLGGEVYPEWGLRGHWIAAVLWASWLLFLAIHKTGDDYLHITRRFGIVAASQLPVHYMLSMKSLYSPFAIAFRSSHEELNPYHRLSGRIIYSFLLLHMAFYMNFFIRAGLLKVRLTSLVPLLGVLAFTLLTTLASTSLSRLRKWSYRVFFILHLTIAVSILPVLFFHASPLRLYVVESLALFVFNILARKLNTITTFPSITSIARTKLIKLTVPIPTSKMHRFEMTPGQHVYLSIPPGNVPSGTLFPSIHCLLYNPFTVADVSATEILLVLRSLHGPTTAALEQLTKLTKAKPGINIEGPYGIARQFPSFATEFDRILLVAGGIGSTFILPIYRRIIASMPSEGHGTGRVEVIWSMRSVAEANWASGTGNPTMVGQDENIKIYVTGSASRNSQVSVVQPEPEDESIEMEDLRRTERPGHVSGGHTRPNLRRIVDKTFRHRAEERVAVLVCGPGEMVRELREHVGRWVVEGRCVWWHDESFGW